ncbi:MAG: hypothetical protein WB711_24610 [Terriglobales bacterium]
MKKSTLPGVLCTIVVCVALGWAPESALAQRGGHGGGGGFHGGGAHYGYSGNGHFYGGYHGGGYYGGHGGYYGWNGGRWGYPRYGYGYGYGWGFGIGFGWGSYWPAYPYAYGYGAWSVSPYYYYPPSYYCPYYAPSGYPCAYPYSGNSNASPPDSGRNSYDNSPAKFSIPPARKSSPDMNPPTVDVVASTPRVPNYTSDATTRTASNYRLASSTTQQLSPPRREVQNVIQALRAMPPDARRRQIDSGRYSNFSPEELELLNNTAN